MNPRVPTEGYGPTPKLLHWVTVVLVALVWMLGTFGDELSEGSARDTGLFAHISIGLAILVLAAVRVPWRIANPPPKIVATEFGRWLVEWTDPVMTSRGGLRVARPMRSSRISVAAIGQVSLKASAGTATICTM
jgi:cytochrome b